MTWADFYWNTIADRTPDELAMRLSHLQAVVTGADDPEADGRQVSAHWEIMLVRLRLDELRQRATPVVAETETEAEGEAT